MLSDGPQVVRVGRNLEAGDGLVAHRWRDVELLLGSRKEEGLADAL